MKILIVDDEPLVRRSLQRVLQQEGTEILQAADGLQGLKLWMDETPDIVLLDVLMPGLTGPQVLEKIPTDLKTRTKVMMMSAFTGEFSQTKAHELGAELFVPKPFDDIFTIATMIRQMVKVDR